MYRLTLSIERDLTEEEFEEYRQQHPLPTVDEIKSGDFTTALHMGGPPKNLAFGLEMASPSPADFIKALAAVADTLGEWDA